MNHFNVSEAIGAYSASPIDGFEARLQLSSESEGTAKGAENEHGHRKAVYWLISLAAFIYFLVGMLCLMESPTLQTVRTNPLSFTTGGAPSQGKVTFGQAVQAVQSPTLVGPECVGDFKAVS
jgi:hypothetical protein